MFRSSRAFPAIALLLVGALLIWCFALYLSPHGAGLFPRSERVAFALPVVLLSLLLVVIHRRAGGASILGEARDGIPRSFALGMLCFAIPFAITLAICLATGLITLQTDAGFVSLALHAAAAVALVLLAEALPEELVFRGAIQSQLRREMPVWPAIIVQSLLFTLFAWAIGAAPNPLDASFLFTFGIVLGLLKVAAALPAAIGFHLAFMSTQQFLGPAWGLFEVGNPQLLQMLVCAIIPFSATIIFLQAHGR